MFSESRDQARSGLVERWLRLTLILLVSFASLAGAFFIFSDIDHQLEASRVAHLDNRTWVLAQLEVDVLNLQAAVHHAQFSEGDPQRLEQVREKFDILYSRIDIIGRSEPDAILNLQHSVLPDFVSQDGFFARWTPLIDGPDAALSTALPRFIQEMEGLSKQVRQGVVDTLGDVMRYSDVHRHALRQSLQQFAVAALGLLGLMAILIVVVIVQSSARRRRGVLLERSVHNLRATIESSLDAVVVLDHMGRVVECNRAALVMFRWEEGGPNGADFVDYIRNDDADTLLRPQRRDEAEADLLPGGTDGRITMMAQRRDGSSFPIEVSVAEAQGATKDPFFIAFIRDISERLEREESLKKARNEAQQGEEAKSRFLAVMSHEMRTPLNGLMAASDLLQTSTELTERQRWLSDIIVSCGTAALDQVNNVLELTRLSSHEGESYTSAAFSPTEVIENLIRQNLPHAAKRGNKLWFTAPKAMVPPVVAPRHLFLRVMYNLIGNAIKFTDSGKISVELLSQPGAAPGTIELTVQVNDTGIGIAEEDLDLIFRNFETLDASYGRIREGTGLGLGIAKLAAESMGGRIGVQSKLGLGSVFTLTVTLPLAEETDAVDVEPDEDALIEETPARSILVAEDNPVNRQLLCEMLRLAGHEVTLAEDGAEAAAAARERRFDLILMDISMPRVDGLEATRMIRLSGASIGTPVVGATAHANPDKFPEFLAAGMNDILVKPITRAALFRAIRFYTSGLVEDFVPKAPMPSPSLPLVDHELRADLIDNLGEAYIATMAQRVIEEARASVDEISRLHETGDYEAAARAAHKTAGAAAAIGLVALHGSFSAYETAVARGEVEEASLALDRLPVTLELTVAALPPCEDAA